MSDGPGHWGSLSLAVGIALSPVPIIAVVLILTSRTAKVNGPAFVLGWLTGLGILLLAVGGAAAIAGTGISGGEQVIAYLVFALIGTLGVGTPVVIYFAMGRPVGEAAGRAEGLDERPQRRDHDRPVPGHRGQAHRRRDQRPSRLGNGKPEAATEEL